MCNTRESVWVHVCACGECRRVYTAKHDKMNRTLHAPWSIFLSGNVGVGPLVALRCWLSIVQGQPPARSEYGNLMPFQSVVGVALF